MSKKYYFLSIMIVMALCACEKSEQKEPEQPKKDTLAIQAEEINAYLLSPITMNGIFVEMSNAMVKIAPNVKRNSLPSTRKSLFNDIYPTYSWESIGEDLWPINLMINYGEEGVVGIDGLKHQGTLSIRSTGLFETPGTVLTPTFDAFYVYGNHISGEQTITNEGFNERNHLVYDVVTKNARLGAQEQFVYSEQTKRELTKGLLSDNTLDTALTKHTYSITGTMDIESTVDTIPGCTIGMESTNPMVITVGDLYPIAGLLHITLKPAVEYTFTGDQLLAMMGGDATTSTTTASPSAFSSMTVTVTMDKMELEFLGKNTSDQYDAKVKVTLKMEADPTLTAMLAAMGKELSDIEVAYTFSLDEKGVVEGSLQPVVSAE